MVAGDGAIRLDRPVLEWFARHREPWLTMAMRLVTGLGSSVLLIRLVLGAGAWFRWRGRARPAMLLAMAYAGADLLSRAIRALTGRARPPAALVVAHFAGHAFP